MTRIGATLPIGAMTAGVHTRNLPSEIQAIAARPTRGRGRVAVVDGILNAATRSPNVMIMDLGIAGPGNMPTAVFAAE